MRRTLFFAVVLLSIYGCQSSDDPTRLTSLKNEDLPAIEEEEAEYILNPPVANDGGYCGVVVGSSFCGGEQVPGAVITFIAEDGRHAFRTCSDEEGYYRRRLWPGRYHVIAEHPDYETYSTCCGFFIYLGEGWQTGHVVLPSLGPICEEGEKTTYDPDKALDKAPTAEIYATPDEVMVGEPVTITIVGTDDVELVTLWWGTTVGCLPNCRPAVFADCTGLTYCTQTWTMSFDAPGRFVLYANARDNMYPTPGEPHQASEGLGMGCAEFRVLE